MALSKKHLTALNQIITTAQKLIDSAEAEGRNTGKNGSATRVRRTAKDAEKMKSDIRKARAKGVTAAELAEKYGVSSAYIYMIGK